jgi:hypothetical protein
MIHPHVEYVGFSSDAAGRNYKLRVTWVGKEARDFVFVIPFAAFSSQRVRYQDAPEICYLRLLKDLAACGEGVPPWQQTVTDADIDDYRTAHSPKPSGHRRSGPVPSQS